MAIFLGLDIGSVSAKLALVDENGSILHLDSQRISSTTHAAVAALMERMGGKYALEQVAAAGLSGAGKAAFSGKPGWGEYSSSLAIASGLLHSHPDARTIIQIGGQTSHVIELQDGLKKPWKTESNPLCAAGTGRFIEQQAYRLGISMNDFASLALKCEGSTPRIAARCSVFAKTDLIHLQQKGAPVESMLYALCESVARMVASLSKEGIAEPLYFVGGVAGNAAMVRSLADILSAKHGRQVEVIVPKNHLYIEAIGSALLSRNKAAGMAKPLEADKGRGFFEMPPLEIEPDADKEPLLCVESPCTGYLGIDVGSTSTKAVIMDESGRRVLAKHYLMTAGRPIDAVRELFSRLLADGAGRVTIAGAGITGSGRYLAGRFIGADLIKNEITAQTRAAAEIDPEADIIEIGGQDSKLVIKRSGVVIDYQMNKACAAGTGSFIDELAEMLGISVKNGDFARLAFNAPYTIDLGTRCAAFMGQAVAAAQQEGASLEVITASLASSIAKNYLSKVVGNRKLGSKVILTGAVFYNRAVVSAFRRQLEGKKLMVPEHKEISGAIGAALLARESMAGGSTFKGFQEVVDQECNLSTFTCKECENNCAVTRLKTAGEKPAFYGSRCDRYEAVDGGTKRETFFDAREKLLLKDYRPGDGIGPTVGIPRALLVYDYAPLLIGFLNALDARVILTGKTNRETTEQALELSYTDSCFPLKLLHGHAAGLNQADFILYPCAIRLGEKEGAENQKYACPLVQASPYIIKEALGLGERLLIPVLDFSQGNEEVIESLAGAALKMGYNRRAGRAAAAAGLEAQTTFETERSALGRKLLGELRQSGPTGVVLFARSYMSQDSGANLGIAEILSQLGVVPIPLDFLPLDEIDPRAYSDRPYWAAESKHIAGAAIVAADPQLFGLVLTNFGCGPNSFMLKVVEDIMGGKPLGQLEIDEHAAEAGIVTRLEAFVDTIRGFGRPGGAPAKPDRIYRGASPVINTNKTIVIPRMASHAEVLAAAMEACGAKVMVLPEPDERSLEYSNQVTSGTECLPYRVCLGDFIRYYHDSGGKLDNIEGFMAGSYGPCRLGKYSIEQMRVLREMGIDLPLLTSVSNNAYRDLNLGTGFERLAWKGVVAFDYLERLLWRTRPYEKEAGLADRLFADYGGKVTGMIRRREFSTDVLKQAAAEFGEAISPALPRRPVVGINGEIFLRSNSFSNHDLIGDCERAGLEVVVSPMGEWLKYISFRNIEDAFKDRKPKKAAMSLLKSMVQQGDEHAVAKQCRRLVEEELSTADLLSHSRRYLSPKCGSEAPLSLGSGITWLRDKHFAGVISVMPHGCMPGGIVGAMSAKLSALYEKPWINLTYDGGRETNNLARISDFAEIISYCYDGNERSE
jgi:predicted CoA-substrate-specific enzyme activase